MLPVAAARVLRRETFARHFASLVHACRNCCSSVMDAATQATPAAEPPPPAPELCVQGLPSNSLYGASRGSAPAVSLPSAGPSSGSGAGLPLFSWADVFLGSGASHTPFAPPPFSPQLGQHISGTSALVSLVSGGAPGIRVGSGGGIEGGPSSCFSLGAGPVRGSAKKTQKGAPKKAKKK